MINTPLCNECLCLAVCVSKTDRNLIAKCRMFENTILNICAGMIKDDQLVIFFRGLNRGLSIKKGLRLLTVQTNDPTFPAGVFYLRPLICLIGSSMSMKGR